MNSDLINTSAPLRDVDSEFSAQKIAFVTSLSRLSMHVFIPFAKSLLFSSTYLNISVPWGSLTSNPSTIQEYYLNSLNSASIYCGRKSIRFSLIMSCLNSCSERSAIKFLKTDFMSSSPNLRSRSVNVYFSMSNCLWGWKWLGLSSGSMNNLVLL